MNNNEELLKQMKSKLEKMKGSELYEMIYKLVVICQSQQNDIQDLQDKCD